MLFLILFLSLTFWLASGKFWEGKPNLLPSLGESKPPVRIYYENKVVVLAYHHLAPEEKAEETATLSCTRFASHLDALKEAGFQVVPLETVEALLRGERIPPNAVALTFDDGYQSFATYAFPELKKRGMPTAVFLIVSKVGSRGGVPKLTWKEIEELQERGVAFHSHSYNGHFYAPGAAGKKVAFLTGPVYRKDLGRLETKAEYRARAATDINAAQRLLKERLGVSDAYFSYPYGRSSRELKKILKAFGYRLAFTFDAGTVTKKSDPFALPRLNANSLPLLTGEELVSQIKKAAASRERP